MVNDHFTNEYHKMQETRNSCFGSENTIHRQAKIGKHECNKIRTIYKSKRGGKNLNLLIILLKNSGLKLLIKIRQRK